MMMVMSACGCCDGDDNDDVVDVEIQNMNDDTEVRIVVGKQLLLFMSVLL